MKNKIFAGLVGMTLAIASCFSSVSYALGELENVTLTVYMNTAGAPQGFIEEDVRRPQGIDVDIVYELQRRLMFNLKENRIFPIDRDDALERLKNGKADLVIGGVSFTTERAKHYSFTNIIYSSSLGVMYSTTHNPEFRHLVDLKGKRIAVEGNSTSNKYVERFGAEVVPIENHILGYFMVSTGAIDGLIFDRPPLEDFARTVPSLHLAVLPDEFGTDACQFAFVLAKDSPYAHIITDTIEDMRDDGTLAKILKKWNFVQK